MTKIQNQKSWERADSLSFDIRICVESMVSLAGHLLAVILWRY